MKLTTSTQGWQDGGTRAIFRGLVGRSHTTLEKPKTVNEQLTEGAPWGHITIEESPDHGVTWRKIFIPLADIQVQGWGVLIANHLLNWRDNSYRIPAMGLVPSSNAFLNADFAREVSDLQQLGLEPSKDYEFFRYSEDGKLVLEDDQGQVYEIDPVDYRIDYDNHVRIYIRDISPNTDDRPSRVLVNTFTKSNGGAVPQWAVWDWHANAYIISVDEITFAGAEKLKNDLLRLGVADLELSPDALFKRVINNHGFSSALVAARTKERVISNWVKNSPPVEQTTLSDINSRLRLAKVNNTTLCGYDKDNRAHFISEWYLDGGSLWFKPPFKDGQLQNIVSLKLWDTPAGRAELLPVSLQEVSAAADPGGGRVYRIELPSSIVEASINYFKQYVPDINTRPSWMPTMLVEQVHPDPGTSAEITVTLKTQDNTMVTLNPAAPVLTDPPAIPTPTTPSVFAAMGAGLQAGAMSGLAIAAATQSQVAITAALKKMGVPTKVLKHPFMKLLIQVGGPTMMVALAPYIPVLKDPKVLAGIQLVQQTATSQAVAQVAGGAIGLAGMLMGDVASLGALALAGGGKDEEVESPSKVTQVVE